jgi:hypothetical protein
LFKEGEEEGGISEALMRRAIPVGAISYRMETELGIRDDVLFVYDSRNGRPDFQPRNSDGEIVEFM